jgi:hypothetical protein
LILECPQVSLSPRRITGTPLAITLLLPGNAAFAEQWIGGSGHGAWAETADINFASGLPFTVIFVWGVRAAPPPEFVSPTLTTGLVILLFIV